MGYVLFYNWTYYSENLTDIVRLWDGGMSFHGGFVGVMVAVLIYCRVNVLPLWSGADLVAVSTPPGLFFGRVANFINAELWGRPTELPWGVVFPGNRAQVCDGVIGLCARHPSQLYEAVLEGALLFLLMTILVLKGGFKKPGFLTATFLVGYGLSRFFIEYFRVPDPQFFSISNPFGFAIHFGEYGLTMGQILCIPMIILGLVLMVVSIFVGRQEPDGLI